MANTVTFLGDGFERTRWAAVDSRQFPVGVPVSNVSDETISQLKDAGYKIKVQSDKPAEGSKKES